MPRGILFQRAREAAGLSVDEWIEGRANPRLLRRRAIQGLVARGDGRAGVEGAAPGIRAVEPGHSRAIRCRMRGLSYALQTRGRAENQRSPRPQPDAEHQSRVPDLSQMARSGIAGPRRDDPRAYLLYAQSC